MNLPTISELQNLVQHPSISDLRRWRHEALVCALAMYRHEHTCHPRDTRRAEWERSRIYWTTRAFQYHGEIMAQIDAAQNTPERMAQLARYWDYFRNRD